MTGVSFALGAVARYSLLSTSYGTTLDYYQLSTPATSAPCLHEGHHLSNHGHDPLAIGGACAPQPPLLIVTLATLCSSLQLYVLLAGDLLCAVLLLHAAPAPTVGVFAAVAHLLAPWSIAASATGSSTMLHGLAMLVMAHLGARSHALAAMAAIAIACMLAPDAVCMIFAVVALSNAAGSPTLQVSCPEIATIAVVRCASAFGLAMCTGLALLAPQFGGTSHLLRRTHGAWVDAEPSYVTTPNVGLWWHLFTQAFLPIRPTFVLAMHTLPRLCVPCLALAVLTHPPPTSQTKSTPAIAAPSLRRVALSHVVLTVTKLGPTVPEIILALAFVGSQLDERFLINRLLPLACIAIAIAVVTIRSLLLRWFDARELNANFYYAATMLHGTGHLLIAYELSAAPMRNDAEARADCNVTCVQRAC